MSQLTWAVIAACVLAMSLSACSSPAATTPSVSSVTTQLPAGMRVRQMPQPARVETEFGRLDLDVELSGRDLVHAEPELR